MFSWTFPQKRTIKADVDRGQLKVQNMFNLQTSYMKENILDDE